MKWSILLAALLVILGGLTWVILRSGEPVYRGKPISRWINEVGVFANPPAPSLPLLDSNAVPFLVEALQRQDGQLRRVYLRIWNKLPSKVQNRLPQPVPGWAIRANAAALLGTIGKDARPAIPALIHALKTDKVDLVRQFSAKSLAQIGARDKLVMEALAEAAAKDTEASVRFEALNALKEFNLEIPALIER
jgi:HEAT repeat protein